MAMAEVKLSEGDPLDRLPTLVNDVLIQIGRAFRDPSLRDPKLSSLDVKTKNQQVIPQANLDFHDVLDDLEIEIENAKAVFERDLALIRAKRAEREKAAGISRLRPADDDKISNTGLPLPVASIATRKHGNANQDSLDIDMPDATPFDTNKEDASATQSPHPTQSEALQQSTDATPKPPQLAQIATSNPYTQAQPSGDNIDPAPNTSSVPAPVTTTAPPVSTSPPATPLSATFASMFPDPSPNDLFGSTDQNDFNFDIDFSNMDDAGATGAVLDLTALSTSTAPQNGPAATSAAGAADGETGAAEDINSLLPGLENFVNSGADFEMLELGNGTDAAVENIPALDANAFAGAESSEMHALPTTTTMEQGDKSIQPAAGESSFGDALFFADAMAVHPSTGLEDTNSQNGGGDGDANDDMVDFNGPAPWDEGWFKDLI